MIKELYQKIEFQLDITDIMLAKQQVPIKSLPVSNNNNNNNVVDTSMSDSINYPIGKSVVFNSGTDESNAMATEDNESALA